MTDQLKPCPFCGSNTITIVGIDAYCLSCVVKFSFPDFDPKGHWNTRHESEKYEKLLKLIKEISGGFCFTDTDYQGLDKLVKYEREAERILKELQINFQGNLS
jgi:hypothetical protein